jgi:hypothetical protein
MLDSVSLTEVAPPFGVRTTQLVRHVRDLAALRDGITMLALGELSTQIGDAIAGRPSPGFIVGFRFRASDLRGRHHAACVNDIVTAYLGEPAAPAEGARCILAPVG